MDVTQITELYNLLTTSDNIFNVRGKLHNLCDKVDFEVLEKKYLSSDKISRMIKYIKKEYLATLEAEKTVYKISDEELNRRIAKLKIVDELFKSCNNPYIRFDRLSKMFKNPNIMYKTYILLIRFGKDDPKLNEIRPLLNNFDKYYHEFRDNFKNDVGKTVRAAYKDEEKETEYNYAKFIIEQYINRDDSFNLEDFLNDYAISVELFHQFIKLIKIKNKSLYYEYVLKAHSNERNLKHAYMFTIDDLYYAIHNNEFIYGNKFDLLEFIKLIPFKDEAAFLNKLDDFLAIYNKVQRSTILNYVKENNLDEKDAFKPLNPKEIQSKKGIINGQLLSETDMHTIVAYLIKRDIPICKASVKEAGKMYLNKEFSFAIFNDDIITRERIKPIIIPNNKKDAI